MSVTIDVSTLKWMNKGGILWGVRIDDLSGSTVTFSKGYEPTVSGKLVKVTNDTRPTGTVTYTSIDDTLQPSAALFAVNSAVDTEDFVKGKKVQRIGSVDMSLLSWTAGDGVYTATVNDIKSGTANVMCSKGYPVTVSGTIVTVTSSSTPTGYLYYELATPTTSDVTPTTVTFQKGTNVLVQTSGNINSTPLSITYPGTRYNIPAVSSSKYLVRVTSNGETTESIQTSKSSVAVDSETTKVVDLTHWFGKNREPSSVAAFYQLYPLWKTYDIPYMEGSLFNFTGTSIKSIGFNAYNHATGTAKLLGGNQYQICGTYTAVSYTDIWGDEETLDIDSDGIFTPLNDGTLTVTGCNDTDTCVHLTWSGYKNYGTDGYKYEPYEESVRDLQVATYFPDGMNGIGDVRDELHADKVVKRLALVDMSTLTWTAGDGVYTATVNDIKSGTTNVVTSKGYTVMVSGTTVTVTAAISPTGYMVYELATPVVTPISPELNLSYTADDFGTEQLIPVNTTSLVTTIFNGLIKHNLDFTRTVVNLSKIQPTLEKLAEDEPNIARQNGDYRQQGLIAADAGNLIDKYADPTTSMFSFRTTAGEESVAASATAEIRTVKGSTQIANQLVHDTNPNTASASDGVIQIEDGVEGEATGFVMEGDAYARNQLVPDTAQPKDASGNGLIQVTDAVIGDANGLVMAGASYVRNQLVDTTGTLTLNPDHVYLFNDNGVSSRITEASSQAVTADEDMLVDLTQLCMGNSSVVAAIQTWEDLVARYPEYKDHVPYDTGTLVGSQPTWKAYGDEHAYGIIMDTTDDDIPCQRVEYNNGVITNVESFTSLNAHDWHRCVMDDLANRHVNYYLDPTDSDKKYNGTYHGVTSDGSASTLTGEDGDVMVEMGITHWRLIKDYGGTGKHLYLVSDRPFRGSEIHPLFYTSPNGDTPQTQYVGAYKGCLCDADGYPLNTTEGALAQNNGTASTRKYRSLAGALPCVSLSLADMRTASTRNGGTMVNFWFHHYVYLMMMIEYATVDTQSISQGYSNGIQNAFCFWRKSGRTNYGNGTGQTLAVEGTQDMDNFQSFKVGSTTVQRDTLKDADGRYAWSIYNRNASSTRYFTASATPVNGDTVYSASTGDTSAGTVSSYTIKADSARVIQFQYRGLENPFGEVWEFEDGFQKYQTVAVAKVKSSTNVIFNRDTAQDAEGAYAWKSEDGTTTIWTASANPGNSTACYSDSAKTTSTGYTVSPNQYAYSEQEFWHTTATSDYTSTAQHGNANPTYYKEDNPWPPSGYVKNIDPYTLLAVQTGSPASGSKRFRDYFYNDTSSGSRVSYVGGFATYGASVGLGCRNVSYALTYSNVYFGGRASAR